jgi:hypothetical protein
MGGSRHYDCEAASPPRLAGHVDAASVLFHDLLDDGKADSRPDFTRLLRLLCAVELLEDLFDFLLVHPDALILDPDPDLSLVSSGKYRNLSILRGILHRISK